MIEPVITTVGTVAALLLVLGGLVWALTRPEPRTERETAEEKKNRRILREIESWRDGK